MRVSSPAACMAPATVFSVGRKGAPPEPPVDAPPVLVVSADGEVISTNKLDEPVDATLALVGNQIFIRSKNSLYCIGKD